MHFVAVALVLMAPYEPSLADRCRVTDCLEQLIHSVQSIQGNGGGECGGPVAEPRVGKAGPIGPPGPRGPPVLIDMAAIEQLIQRKINEMCYMGMKSRLIPDSAISASSFYAPQYEPYLGRLDNHVIAGTTTGSWASRTNAVGQWLQIDLGNVKEVAGVITQGRSYTSQWVTAYKVSCGKDLRSLARVQENGRDKQFRGNNDRDTKVYNRFPKVLSCRFIRIYPQSWHVHISMRVEIVSGKCFDKTWMR